MKPSSSPSKFSTALLVFFSSNLLLLFSSHPRASKTKETALEPISFILSRISAAAMAYLSHMVYHGVRPSLENLLDRLAKSWKQMAVTLAYIELINTASASLLLTLAAVGRSAKGAALEAAVMAGAACLISWLAPLLFVHSDAACKISLIVSMAEEDCRGERALERAGELVKEKKARGFALMVMTVGIDQAMNRMFRFGSGVLLLQLLVMFFTYLMYTSLYYDCKEKSSLKGEKVL